MLVVLLFLQSMHAYTLTTKLTHPLPSSSSFLFTQQFPQSIANRSITWRGWVIEEKEGDGFALAKINTMQTNSEIELPKQLQLTMQKCNTLITFMLQKRAFSWPTLYLLVSIISSREGRIELHWIRFDMGSGRCWMLLQQLQHFY